ncbi:30S ribosome-binding factor RbfA [Thiotrichales bacterium 19S3-7]|nr:30S ribosome-binding factor RbfA [Thiotrichales bacterium 19S3-7]MCF6800676.1 30S ribosome-binding factor RbfA [Thiotrichales bacterium 19S3-11]
MAGSSRVYRVADEIQRLIVTAIRKKIRNPKFQWVSITSVDVSKDLSYAKVYYTSLSEDTSQTDLAEAFNKAKGFFRSYLAKELSLRIVPNLRFIYDDSLEYGSHMTQLIDSALEADEAFISKDDQSEETNESDQKDVPKDKRKRLR